MEKKDREKINFVKHVKRNFMYLLIGLRQQNFAPLNVKIINNMKDIFLNAKIVKNLVNLLQVEEIIIKSSVLLNARMQKNNLKKKEEVIQEHIIIRLEDFHHPDNLEDGFGNLKKSVVKFVDLMNMIFV